VLELPRIFNSTHPITISASSITGAWPAWLLFNDEAFFRDYNIPITAADFTVQLKAEDGWGGISFSEFNIQTFSTKPTILTANTSCADWLQYTYLDDETNGTYYAGFALCF